MLCSKLHAGLMSEYRIKCSRNAKLWRDTVPVGFHQPFIEPPDSFMNIDGGGPTRRHLELPDIGDVISLVARTRLLHLRTGPFAMQVLNQFEEVQQADDVPHATPDVEDLPR